MPPRRPIANRTPGTQRTPGTRGTQGTPGTRGTQGTPGTRGTQGTPGTRGTQGTPGTRGTQGTPGTRGTPSTLGIQGPPGTRGTQNTLGTQGTQGTPGTPEWSHLRLTDRITRDLLVLFVGINPGVRSATTGHHFAGYSNRFWKLLFESRLVPEPITYVDDRRLLDFGFGVTNLVARPSPGIDDLAPAEYVEGWHMLEPKIQKYRP